jgi:hypothetical protein
MNRSIYIELLISGCLIALVCADYTHKRRTVTLDACSARNLWHNAWMQGYEAGQTPAPPEQLYALDSAAFMHDLNKVWK